MANLTRILNNQIYSKTIIASQKIADGTITGTLFSSNVTVPGDLLISGNLFVLGTSAYTTIASTNTYVNDPLIVMNNGFAGTNTYDEGIIFNRGTLQNRAFLWSEFNQEFRLVGTTETGTTYGNVTVNNYAKLHLGNITVDYTANITNLNATGLINTTGNVSAATVLAQLVTSDDATFGNVASGFIGNVGTVFTGASINLSGNILASTVLSQLVTADDATFGNVASGFVGNVGTQFTGASINLSGNVSAATVLSQLVTADDATFGNVASGFVGNVGTAFTGASINLSGNVLASTVIAQLHTGSTATFGNISAATIGNAGASLNGGTLTISGNVIGGLAQFAAINSTPIGNATASSGAFTTLVSSGITEVTNSTTATGVGTGAFRVAGGASITGNLYIGGNLNIVGSSFVLTGNSGVFYGDVNGFNAIYVGVTGYTPLPQTVLQSSANFNGYVQNNFENLSTGTKASTDWVATAGDGTDVDHYIDMGITTVNWNGTQDNSLTNAVGANDGYLYIQGNVTTGQGGNLTIGASTPGAKQVKIIAGGNTAAYISAIFRNPNTQSTTTTTGALTVAGGVGITGNINAGGGLVVNSTQDFANPFTNAVQIYGGMNVLKTAFFGANVVVNSTTPSTSTSSGALTVTGGVGIGGDLYVGGNLFVSNIYGVQANVITVEDPLLFLEPSGSFPYDYDIGFYSVFTGTGLTTAGNVTQFTGVIRDNGTNTWTFASNLGNPTTDSVVFTGTTVYDPIKAGNLSLVTSIPATNNATGALIVTGGAGIGGSLYARDIQATVIGNTTQAAGYFTTLNASGNVLVGLLQASAINNTPIGNATPSTGVFTTITAGSVSSGFIGNTGTAFIGASLNVSGNVLGTGAVLNALTVNGTGTFTTLAATGNVIGGLASFAAINSTPIGNATASTGAFTTLTASAGVWANSATETTSSTTGAIVIPTGGLAVAGNAYVGKNLYVGGPTAFTTALTTPTIVAVDSGGTFAQTALINLALTGSSDYIAYPGDYPGQSNDHGWMDMGFTGTAFNDPNYTITKPQDGYVFASGANTSVGGNLVLATDYTGAYNDIVFGVGSFLATSEVARFRGNVGNNGNLTIKYATPSTSATTGAVVIVGGMGVSGNLNIRGNSVVTLGRDIAGGIVYPENAVQVTTLANVASRISINNKSNGSVASSEFQAVADTGSNIVNFSAMGITSSTFAFPGAQILKPTDSYFYGTGNVVITAGGAGDTILATGFSNVGVRISSTNTNVGVQYTTVSTSATTGAFTVAGGVGLGANLYVRNGATFNAGQSSEDFTVQGKVTTSLILANSNYGALVFGGSNVTPTLGAVAKFNSNDSIQIPVGTSAQRPGTSGNTDVTGMLRFNTTINNLEFYNGTLWQTPSGSFTIITSRQFSGNTAGGFGNIDGTNTSFTISASATTASTLVSINGVLQIPVLAYSVSGSTLTFTEPPAPGDVIDTRALTTSLTVSALASGSGLNQFIADDVNGAEIWSGTSSTVKRVLVDPAGNFNLLTGNKVTYAQSAVNIPATNTATQIDTWSQTTYTTGKYVIQAKVGSTNVESYEALVLTDGSGNAYVTTYGIINNGTTFGTVTANVVGGNVNVYYSSTIAQANVKAMGTFVV